MRSENLGDSGDPPPKRGASVGSADDVGVGGGGQCLQFPEFFLVIKLIVWPLDTALLHAFVSF